MLENVRLAFRGIWSHKMRSFLTMLGIIIGIAAIISIVSIMQGTNEEIKNSLIGSGKNAVKVRLSQGGYEMQFYDSSSIPKNVIQISDEVIKKIEELDEVTEAARYTSRYSSEGVYYQNKPIQDLYIYGIDDNYFETAKYIVQSGRGFMESDYDEIKPVLIIDTIAASQLFAGENPLGRTIEISKMPFTIIGVVKEQKSSEPVIDNISDYYTYQEQTNGALYIPSASWPVVYNFDEPENVVVKARTTDDMPEAGKKTANILNSSVVTDSDQQDSGSAKYEAEDLLGQAANLQKFSQKTNMLLLWIAGISLLVGGIGVMNIMLVSVTERTAEIGLKKAIGARKGAILAQFLTEAAVLTSMGGLLGVAAGIAAAQIINKVTGYAVGVNVPASIVAVVFSMVIGILFGFLPSIQAANLDPIEALRRE